MNRNAGVTAHLWSGKRTRYCPAAIADSVHRWQSGERVPLHIQVIERWQVLIDAHGWPTAADVAAWEADAPRAKVVEAERRKSRRAVRLHPDTHGQIDSTGVQRRIHALAAMGWTFELIAATAGIDQRLLSDYSRGKWKRVTMSTHNKVCGAYDALSMRPGPSWRTAAFARRHQWAPPLAFDDDTIDDPSVSPNYGPRTPDKGRTIAELIKQGETPEGVAARLGIKVASVKRYTAPSRSAA